MAFKLQELVLELEPLDMNPDENTRCVNLQTLAGPGPDCSGRVDCAGNSAGGCQDGPSIPALGEETPFQRFQEMTQHIIEEIKEIVTGEERPVESPHKENDVHDA